MIKKCERFKDTFTKSFSPLGITKFLHSGQKHHPSKHGFPSLGFGVYVCFVMKAVDKREILGYSLRSY